MNRNAIIGICVAFSAIAVGAGWIVAGMSGSPIAALAAQTPPAQAAGEPSTATTSQASALASGTAATTQPSAQSTPEATAEVAPTTAPTAAPTAEPMATTAAPTLAATEPGYIEYTIQKGDLLNSIAKQYNVTTKDIIAINQIANPDSLVVGQVIRIPKK